MKPSQTIELLKRYIVARENLLLVSDPGMGKSEMVDQARRAVNYDLIPSIPGLEDPTEPGGFPWIAEDRSHAEKVLFGQAYRVVNSKNPTVWFWDDFGHGANATQVAYMQWAQARRVENHFLPDHVSIVAATNRRGAGMGVQGVLEPILGRFHVVEVEPDLEDWQAWFIENHEKTYPKAIKVLAFLNFRTELLSQPKQKVGDMVAWPSPRSNFALCRLVQMDLPKDLKFHAYSGAVGAGEATEFLAFEKVFDEMPSLDAIITDPDAYAIPENPATLYAVAVGLASKATENNFGRICRYGERLMQSMKGEWGVLLLRECIRRNKKVCNTSHYIKMSSSPLGRLFRGEG